MKTLHLSLVIITIISLVIIGESNSMLAQIQPAGGPVIIFSTPKSNFADGEIIPISGQALRNLTINIFLVNNYGDIENSTQVKSNSTGYFYTSLGIPSHVIGGAWFLFATSDQYHTTLKIMINSHGVSTMSFPFPSELSPLKQFKLQIEPSYIQCRTDLQLIIKSEDGSPACVTPDTATKLVARGWGTMIVTQKSQNTTLPASFMPCSTPYELKEGFVPVLYMPANSLGKICVNYSNPNNEKNASLAIFEASSHQPAKYEFSSIQPANSITTWAEPSVITIGNSTEVYFVKTGNQTGFYGLTVYCVGMPLAVGYDNQSNITLNDFPWMKQTATAHCLLQDYISQVVGVDGIGIKYISPNP